MTGEADNRCRFAPTRAGRGHHEAWSLTLNHVPTQTGAWIRYAIDQPIAGEARAALWFAHFDGDAPERTVAIHRAYPTTELATSASPFAVTIAGAELRHDRARGRLIGGGHEVAWDLGWAPAPRPLRPLPGLLYLGGGLGETTYACPNPAIRVSGRLEVDGRCLVLDDDPAAQAHQWGRRRPHDWAWAHATGFVGRDDAALELVSARLHGLGRVSPALTAVHLRLGAELHSFHGPRELVRNTIDVGPTHLGFVAERGGLRVEGELSCRAEDLVQVTYADPDGPPVYATHTEIADLRVTLYRRRGRLGAWREAERLVAPRAGHLEVGRREPDLGIGKAHVAI